ncbi:hypothetical protein [Actinomadura rayongensis]|uniref:C1q domain-containing protein n=1 Tax=Actinomadura rayongensis TaxID=1429076 RepID=A0A6I4WC09_9ACTN|nr:hypothetical protein [Actinomadura rayongensis]MXQ67727.1 hypothetical protein [Actinomadura rayongensis]
MGTTTTYKFPFPEPTDAANVPLHLGNAVKAVDTALKVVDDATKPPRARVVSASVPVSNNSASVKVTWSSAEYKVGGTWWTSGEWLTVPVTGVYLITAMSEFAMFGGSTPVAGTVLAVEMTANDIGQGEEYLSGHGERFEAFAVIQKLQTTFHGRLTAGRKVKVQLAQNSGASRNAVSQLTATLLAKD